MKHASLIIIIIIIATTKSSHAVIYLFDILIRTRLFSYQKYLLRLIARGDLEPKRRHIPQVQKCLYHLASFPLLSPAPAYLLNQRHMALYGLRTDAINNTEAEILEKLKRIARLALTGYDHGDADCLFGPDSKDMTQSMSVDSAKSFQLAFSDDIYTEFVNTMKSTTRYSLLDFTSNWLQSQVKRFVVKSIQ